MPKPKWNLNTIYISERLQESLRPISRCALTTVVAPMGYGKTTAVNWYLEQRAKAEAINVIRISVYSDNLEIFWKAYRKPLFGQVLTSYGTILAPRIPLEGDCWQMISAMNWQEKLPAISLLTIFTC